MKELSSKLVKVMAEVTSVGKSGFNSHQKYAYAKEADILEVLRVALVKHNVFIFTSVESAVKDGDLTTVSVKYTLVDADSGNSMQVSAVGVGFDKQDKGIYKAITGANKYFLMKTFQLPTHDDPEDDGTPSEAPSPMSKTDIEALAKTLPKVEKPATKFHKPKQPITEGDI